MMMTNKNGVVPPVAMAVNMNGRPGQYKIANKHGSFSTDYDNRTSYFDVYSEPIRTRYSEVYWKVQDPIPIDPKIANYFSADRIMAVIGYEVDQVRIDHETGREISVPITWAYNHHYTVLLYNARKVRLVQRTNPAQNKQTTNVIHPHGNHFTFLKLQNNESTATSSSCSSSSNTNNDHQNKTKPPPIIPLVHFFSEGNGGEFRLSYHGYPRGYAQLVRSPNAFQITPMQIDTWNRTTSTAAFAPGPIPRSSQQKQQAKYNPLLECPCSDRLPKQWGMTYSTVPNSSDDDDHSRKSICTEQIMDAEECMFGARLAVPATAYEEHRLMIKNGDHDLVDDEYDEYPFGCSVQQHGNGSADIVWKEKHDQKDHTATNIPVERIETAVAQSWIAISHSIVNVSITAIQYSDRDTKHDDNDNSIITMTLVGPADTWFGVGLGASTMCTDLVADECVSGGPYAIIVSNDTVAERRLAFHGAGQVLSNSVTIVSNTVDENGNRTAVLTRPWVGLSPEHFSFDPISAPSLDMIVANGCSEVFAQHCGHTSSKLHFLAADVPMTVCKSGREGTIGGNKFQDRNRCAPFPTSELLTQANPTCSIESYVGGLMCCRHGQSLLDKDQEIPWKDTYLEYRLKFRFYYEEYFPATGDRPGSHQNLVRLYWQTESFAGEYDIVPCEQQEGECVQIITSRWQVRDMVFDCPLDGDPSCCGTGSTDEERTKGIEIIYAAPHCHAPACLSMELYNADTGQLLCSVEPIAGKSDEIYEEFGFIAIPPCLWSSQDDNLADPILLSLNTTLLSIKRNNSTFPHTGEMASWQMRGIVVPRENESLHSGHPLLRH
jgi:hypothetical protein